MKRVNAAVPPELLEAVQERAAKQGVSVAEWVRMSLRWSIEIATPRLWKYVGPPK